MVVLPLLFPHHQESSGTPSPTAFLNSVNGQAGRKSRFSAPGQGKAAESACSATVPCGGESDLPAQLSTPGENILQYHPTTNHLTISTVTT